MALNTVRLRLTLWYSAVLAGLLIVLAFSGYFVLKRNFMTRTDSSIAELSNSFLTTVHAELKDDSGSNAFNEAIAAAIAEHSLPDTIFVVEDESGKLAGSSLSNAHPNKESWFSALPDALSLMSRTARQTDAFRTIKVHGRPIRLYERHFTAQDADWTLIVLQSLQREQEFLESVMETLAFVIPLGILLASVGGYFLARRSLSPVVEMSVQAERIGASNLHQRLLVRNHQDELGRLADSFNGLLDRLDQSFERQRKFVADASHELRTPVAILCGEADVALSQSNRSLDDYRESLGILRAEAKRLKRIVEDLFTLARADAGQYPLAQTDFYLDELVSDCGRNMRTLAAAKHIKFGCVNAGEMPIRADEILIRRMIVNLMDNAIKYTPTGGTVSVHCGRGQSQYTIAVSDSGPGIPEQLRLRVFERFFRVDNSRSRAGNDGGAGLGLSISRWIAEAHQGRLELSNSEAGGSTFTVFLPVSPEAPQTS
jgi:heavy metal sensor kinase